MKHVREGRGTLVYGAKDQEHNNAAVIREDLEKKNVWNLKAVSPIVLAEDSPTERMLVFYPLSLSGKRFR